MSVTISRDVAEAALKKAWDDIGSQTRPPIRMQQLIERVLKARDVTYKYILITGYLAKYVNSSAHTRALQVGSSLAGAYDARSLCHGVVVGFEKSKGNLFGLSNEPFVNKPARHPEHDCDNTQLRNRMGAKALHDALEEAQQATNDKVYQGLVHILRIGSENAANEKQAKVINKSNLLPFVTFIKDFLAEADGGCRLVGVWAAFQTLLYESCEIKVSSPNASDYFSKTAADVEIYYKKVLISASECKQRPLSLDDVNHGIKKALSNGVPEYFFVISAGIEDRHEEQIRQSLMSQGQEIDLRLIDIWSHMVTLATLLNPVRRNHFGSILVVLLRKMRKFESANYAAEQWNKILS
jgi:hypothetical protein